MEVWELLFQILINLLILIAKNNKLNFVESELSDTMFVCVSFESSDISKIINFYKVLMGIGL